MGGADDSSTRKDKASAQTVPASGAATLALDSADALAATQAAAQIAAGTPSLVGATIASRYKVLKRLGEGGMGTVYEAQHTVLEKPVALKVLHPELARKKDLVDRFLQEAKAASRIRHENVIDISDFGSADGHVYFAMELLQGHDLHEELSAAKKAGKLLPWARTKSIFLQICNALSVAHERGIVHRDLKPENVYLVEFRGDPDFVKLLDFGIAKMTEVADSEEGRKLTKTGMLFGTPEYMAPEQARGQQADHRVDIYAMGCMLFLLVSNRLPFQAENFMAVLSQHLTDEPPVIAPETFDQIGAPRELAEVIDRALEKDREYRWQTIDEMVAAICEICGDPLPKERSKPTRVASVDAPGETTRMRTPTDQPRSRTPSGPQRLRTPTGSRTRTPTGPASRSKSPTQPGASQAGKTPEVSWVGSAITEGAASRSKPPTAPPRLRGQTGETPEVSWIGAAASGEGPAAAVSLGPTPEPEQKGHVFAIVSGIVVIATIAAAAYFLGWFGGTKQPDAASVGSGSSAPAAATPAATGVPAAPASNEVLPEVSEIVLDSTPRGATILALPDGTSLGKTPFTLTVVGSATRRQYKLSLAGYDDVTIDVTPSKARIEMKQPLVRSGGRKAASPTATATQSTPPSSDPSTAVTRPDTSTAVTRPDTSPVTKPDTSPVTTPDTSPVTTPEKAPEAKPAPTPPVPPEAPAPEVKPAPPADETPADPPAP